jgi:hypothetical protein
VVGEEPSGNGLCRRGGLSDAQAVSSVLCVLWRRGIVYPM